MYQVDHVFVETHDKYIPELEDELHELHEVRELVAEQELRRVKLNLR